MTDSINSYLEQSKKTFANSLEASTRFDFKNLSYDNLIVKQYEVELRTEYNIETIREETIEGGHISASQKDIHFNDLESYWDAIDKASMEDDSGLSTEEKFKERITTTPYGEISTKTIIQWHDGRIMHEEDCDSCYGLGENVCQSCSGDGEYECTSCGGDGSSSCGCCGGIGWDDESHTDSDGHTHNHTSICACCGGSGNDECSRCGGDGNEKCRNCKGSGQITCNFCDGTTVQTRITEVNTYASPIFSAIYPSDTPDFVSNIIEKKLSFIAFNTEGDTNFVSASIDRIGKSVITNHTASIMVSQFTAMLKGKAYSIIMFGKNHIIYDGEGILTDVLSDDLKRLSDINLDKKLPNFISKAGVVLQDFMESEVHQGALEILCQSSRISTTQGKTYELRTRYAGDITANS